MNRDDLYVPDDANDALGYGKYKTLTPLQVLELDPAYIVWAHEHTHMWAGSEDVIDSAYERISKFRKAKAALVQPKVNQKNVIEEFEQAVYEAYGQFPKPNWIRS